MKSRIKHIKRDEEQLYLVFKKDNTATRNIEKAFQEIDKEFKMQECKDKEISNVWASWNNKNSFNFSLTTRKDIIRLKIKAEKRLIKKILEEIMKNAKFSELHKE